MKDSYQSPVGRLFGSEIDRAVNATCHAKGVLETI
jgi:hypothetical protein